MVYCHHCGKDISEDDKFCPHCGKEVSDKGEDSSVNENEKKSNQEGSKGGNPGTSKSVSSNENGSNYVPLMVGGIIVISLMFAAAVPVMTIEKTVTEEVPVERTVEDQVRLDYNRISFNVEEGAGSTLTGGYLGDTEATYELRNTDSTGGRFEVTFECEGESTEVTLSDSAYVQAGETATLSASTEDTVEGCSSNLDVPTKTVTRTETVMQEKERTKAVEATVVEFLMSQQG